MFIVFEVLILTLWVKVGREKVAELAERNLIPMDQLYSSLTSTYWIMGGSMFLLGSIYFALVGGDIVAKESEDGNLVGRRILDKTYRHEFAHFSGSDCILAGGHQIEGYQCG
ncbi:hypothetical protein OAF33_02345 [bacterium]|nr:hypothetical protein [bacterium]